MWARAFTTAATLGLVLMCWRGAEAAEVKVLAGTAMAGVFAEVGPPFERETGHKLVVDYGATGTLKKQIEGGDAFDVAILLSAMIDDLTKQGKIASGTRAEIARVGMAVGVRAGAAKPDVSSVDAFKRALVSAKSIAYAPEGATGLHLAKVFERLGIADEMKAKTKPQQAPERIAQAVADGDAELGFAAANILLSVRGVELAGLFPTELQNWIVLTAGVAAAARQPDAAAALIKHLKQPQTVSVIKAKGMEPITP